MTLSRRHSAKVLRVRVDNSIVATVIDLWRYLIYDSRGARSKCMPCSSRIITKMLPEILTIEKCDFLKPIVHSQIINSLF